VAWFGGRLRTRHALKPENIEKKKEHLEYNVIVCRYINLLPGLQGFLSLFSLITDLGICASHIGSRVTI
jgi:hypothetical protein